MPLEQKAPAPAPEVVEVEEAEPSPIVGLKETLQALQTPEGVVRILTVAAIKEAIKESTLSDLAEIRLLVDNLKTDDKIEEGDVLGIIADVKLQEKRITTSLESMEGKHTTL